MKIVVGTANFKKKYGLLSNQINKDNEIKKIFNFLEKKKLFFLDTAFSYNFDASLTSISNLKKFNIITKIKLPKKNKSYYVKKIEDNIKKKLILYKSKSIYACLIHDVKDILLKDNYKFLKTLKELKKKKLIKKIGISVYSPAEIDKILKVFKPDIIQLPANIIDRRFLNKKFLLKLKKKKILIQVRSIFLQGLLLTDLKKLNFKNKKLELDIVKIQTLLKKEKINIKKECLLFIKKFKHIDFITFGINNLNELKENLKILNKKEYAIDNYYNKLKLNKNTIDPRTW